MRAPRRVLGVLLAGGASSRFGSPKWAAQVGGRAMAEHGIEALRAASAEVVVIGSDPALSALGVPVRPDREAGRGPLEGIAVGLAWAREAELDAALILACDLPLVSADWLTRVVDAWDDEDAVVTESDEGPEPLCALYATVLLPRVEGALAAGERSPARLLARPDVRALRVRAAEDQETFLNVNRTSDRDAAERAITVLRRKGGSPR